MYWLWNTQDLQVGKNLQLEVAHCTDCPIEGALQHKTKLD